MSMVRTGRAWRRSCRRLWCGVVRQERGQGLFELVATKQSNNQRDPDMNNSMSCSEGRWCTRADALLGVEGIHVSSVTATGRVIVLGVGASKDITGCPDCVVVAANHGRRRSAWTSTSGPTQIRRERGMITGIVNRTLDESGAPSRMLSRRQARVRHG